MQLLPFNQKGLKKLRMVLMLLHVSYRKHGSWVRITSAPSMW